jgi:hypothetical protein
MGDVFIDQVVEALFGFVAILERVNERIIEAGGFVQFLGEVWNNLPAYLNRAVTVMMERVQLFVSRLIEQVPIMWERGVEMINEFIRGMQEFDNWGEVAQFLITAFGVALLAKKALVLVKGKALVLALVAGALAGDGEMQELAVTLLTVFVAALVLKKAVVNATMGAIVIAMSAYAKAKAYLVSVAGAKLGLALKIGIAGAKFIIIGVAVYLIINFIDGLLGEETSIWEVGRNILDFVVNGIRSIFSAIINVGRDLVARFLEGVRNRFSQLRTAGREVLNTVRDAIIGAFTGIVNAGRNLVNRLRDGVRERRERMVEAGRSAAQGFANGVTGRLAAVRDAAVSLGSTLWNGVRNFLGINSPSRLMRDDVGVYVPQGIAKGIEKEGNVVKKAIDGLFDGEYGFNGLVNLGLEVGEGLGSIGETLASLVAKEAPIPQIILDGRRLDEGVAAYEGQRFNAERNGLAW